MVNGTLGDLRKAFDEAFASPLDEKTPHEDLLAVTIAGDPYAFRIRDIASLWARPTIVPLPSRRSDLLGLAGLRGALVPVYSLALTMGYPMAGPPPRWLVACGSRAPLAFAFEEFERYLRVPTSEIRGGAPPGRQRSHVDQLAGDGPLLRGIVDLTSIVRALTEEAPQEGRIRR